MGRLRVVNLFDENSFPAGLVTGVPSWLLIPVVLVALVGSIGQGAMNLYSMGLDLDAILPCLTWMQATIVMTVVSTVLVFLGKFIWMPKVAVTVRRLPDLNWPPVGGDHPDRVVADPGSSDQPDLQVFNQRRTGGRYWYSGGWNAAAVLAWITGSVVGILSNATDSYTGPIAVALGGVDASFITSGVAVAVVYLLLITVATAAAHGRNRRAGLAGSSPDSRPASSGWRRCRSTWRRRRRDRREQLSMYQRAAERIFVANLSMMFSFCRRCGLLRTQCRESHGRCIEQTEDSERGPWILRSEDPGLLVDDENASSDGSLQ